MDDRITYLCDWTLRALHSGRTGSPQKASKPSDKPFQQPASYDLDSSSDEEFSEYNAEERPVNEDSEKASGVSVEVHSTYNRRRRSSRYWKSYESSEISEALEKYGSIEEEEETGCSDGSSRILTMEFADSVGPVHSSLLFPFLQWLETFSIVVSQRKDGGSEGPVDNFSCQPPVCVEDLPQLASVVEKSVENQREHVLHSIRLVLEAVDRRRRFSESGSKDYVCSLGKLEEGLPITPEKTLSPDNDNNVNVPEWLRRLRFEVGAQVHQKRASLLSMKLGIIEDMITDISSYFEVFQSQLSNYLSALKDHSDSEDEALQYMNELESLLKDELTFLQQFDTAPSAKMSIRKRYDTEEIRVTKNLLKEIRAYEQTVLNLIEKHTSFVASATEVPKPEGGDTQLDRAHANVVAQMLVTSKIPLIDKLRRFVNEWMSSRTFRIADASSANANRRRHISSKSSSDGKKLSPGERKRKKSTVRRCVDADDVDVSLRTADDLVYFLDEFTTRLVRLPEIQSSGISPELVYSAVEEYVFEKLYATCMKEVVNENADDDFCTRCVERQGNIQDEVEKLFDSPSSPFPPSIVLEVLNISGKFKGSLNEYRDECADYICALAKTFGRMRKQTTPSGKLRIIKDCIGYVYSLVGAFAKAENHRLVEEGKADADPDAVVVGADDFLPMWIFAVLKSGTNCPNLPSQLEFIKTYASEAVQAGESGYYLSSTELAVSYLSAAET